MYDNNGNIVKRREFAFTLKDNTLIEELESTDKVYIYNGDQMVSYNGQTCVYDLMGNPTTYRGKAATWVNGRRLASYDGHAFTYDGQGRRLTKDSVVFAYDSNGRLIKQGDNMEFFYDQTGVVGLKYGATTYLYRKDAQGNVIALIGENGAIVARYLYDAWGKVSVVDNNGSLISDANHIGNLNPFRYRGYYYDTETELYFLKTRYYDPEIGRFMTIDGIKYLNPEIINGLNLYAYCGNNPVMGIDPNGNAWWNPFSWAWSAVGETINQVAQTISNTVQQVSSSIQTFVNNIQVDISNYDINNTDPQKVIEANYFSAYRGEFALKSSILDNAGFSFGIMVIGNNVTSHNLIRHEYGHYFQLQEMGLWRFTFEVAIPSITAFWIDELGKLDYEYLELPWEYEASKRGGDTDYKKYTPNYNITYWDLLKMLF